MQDYIIQISNDCVSEVLDDKTVILHLGTGKYHQLNNSGTKIWEEIKISGIKFSELVCRMEAKYNVSELEEDIRLFLDQLILKGIVIRG